MAASVAFVPVVSELPPEEGAAAEVLFQVFQNVEYVTDVASVLGKVEQSGPLPVEVSGKNLVPIRQINSLLSRQFKRCNCFRRYYSLFSFGPSNSCVSFHQPNYLAFSLNRYTS